MARWSLIFRTISSGYTGRFLSIRHMAVSMVTKTPVRPIPALGREKQRLGISAQPGSTPHSAHIYTHSSPPWTFPSTKHSLRECSQGAGDASGGTGCTRGLGSRRKETPLCVQTPPPLIHTYPEGQLPQKRWTRREGGTCANSEVHTPTKFQIFGHSQETGIELCKACLLPWDLRGLDVRWLSPAPRGVGH